MVNLRKIAYAIEHHPNIIFAFHLYLKTVEKFAPELTMLDRWQWQDFGFIFKFREMCLNRARGGSKTRDMSLLIIFLTIRGNDTMWLTPLSKQLLRAMKYWNKNPFVKKFNQHNNKLNFIHCINGYSLEIAVATPGNIQGPRKNVIFIDEMCELDHATADYIMPIFNGMSKVQDGIILICFSTPRINTVFEDYCNTYPTINRDWKFPTWFEQSRLLRQKRTMAPSRWLSEYCCQFSAGEGQVFETSLTKKPYVVYDQYGNVRPDEEIWRPEIYYGSDPNPREGYCLVGVQYSRTTDKEGKYHIRVVYVKNFGPNQEGKMKLFSYLIPQSKIHTVKIELEDNGVGKPVWDDYHYGGGRGNRIDWGSGKGPGDKVARANHMNKCVIHIPYEDPTIPYEELQFWKALWSQLNAVTWTKDGKKIEKPPDQAWHLSDSCMHACARGAGYGGISGVMS